VRRGRRSGRLRATTVLVAGLMLPLAGSPLGAAEVEPLFNDSHFHLTNYVQQGPSLARFVEIMGDRVGRSTLFGIPLQQTWSYANSGDDAPTYYLHSDAPLYYYSFTDAFIAMQFRSLSPEQQARFDPMITGFNPADMYAADHIRRVLLTFPGVFSGIGEFSIHKEFVSAKVAGEKASLLNPALDRILELAAEAGLAVLIHNDIDVPFAKEGAAPAYLADFKDVLRRHPDATVIWAHLGLGRVIHPVLAQATSAPGERNPRQGELIEQILKDPSLDHLYFDISWDEVAKYVLAGREVTRRTADLINAFPDRFLFGTDNVAPGDQAMHLAIHRSYEPLWKRLTPAARRKVLLENYERIFDGARARVRAWEREHASESP
jgi:hypothetical protein